MTHALPISAPFQPSEVDRVLQMANSTALCEYYLDIQPLILKIHALIDKLKNVGDKLSLSTVPFGDLHLQVSGLHMFIGAEYRKLSVIPPGDIYSFDSNSPGNRFSKYEHALFCHCLIAGMRDMTHLEMGAMFAGHRLPLGLI